MYVALKSYGAQCYSHKLVTSVGSHGFKFNLLFCSMFGNDFPA